MARSWKTVRQVLALKRREVFAVAPDDTVFAALETMAAKDVGALVVLDRGRLVGILSERDCARRVELAGRTAKQTAVREIMTAEVVTVTPDNRVDLCMLLMRRHHLRHLPVVEGATVLTVLSSRDVLEEVIAEDEHLIRALETDRLAMTTDTGSY
jgi:CBS domain-containing protein